MTGKTVFITGANSGLGLETAKIMASHGAAVTIAVRNTTKGEEAAATIGHGTTVRPLDLASLTSIRALVAGWSEARSTSSSTTRAWH